MLGFPHFYTREQASKEHNRPDCSVLLSGDDEASDGSIGPADDREPVVAQLLHELDGNIGVAVEEIRRLGPGKKFPRKMSFYSYELFLENILVRT